MLQFFLEFEPLFAMITKSKYAKHYVFKEGITQLSALRDNLKDHPDEVEEGYERMRPINPCNFDFVFHGVRKGMYQNKMYGCMSIIIYGHKVVNVFYCCCVMSTYHLDSHILLLYF